MEAAGSWCLIESDPGVFSELIKGFGVEGIEFEEVYDLTQLEGVSDALGFVLLFKWEKGAPADKMVVTDERERNVFFAKQRITNACATQAIINILLNLSDASVQLGPTLTEFKNFVANFDSEMKGVTLSNSEKIRSVHNSFTNQQIFEFERKTATKDDDVYHFVSYLPVNGVLYELDGLKEGPVEHGIVEAGKDWLEVLRPVLETRIQKCPDGSFNLMAVVPHRLSMYEKQLKELQSRSYSKEVATELENNISREKEKAACYRAENIRRRHNYLPFIVELLKVLGENHRLTDLVKQAKHAAEERRKKQKVVDAKK